MRVMINRPGHKLTKRGGRKLPAAFAAVASAVFLCCAQARAQEGDLSGSAGVFIEPGRARAAAPREKRAPQRAATRRAKPKPAAAPARPPAGPRTPAVTAESLNARAETAIDAGRFREA